jgi:hypothetical protein
VQHFSRQHYWVASVASAVPPQKEGGGQLLGEGQQQQQQPAEVRATAAAAAALRTLLHCSRSSAHAGGAPVPPALLPGLRVAVPIAPAPPPLAPGAGLPRASDSLLRSSAVSLPAAEPRAAARLKLSTCASDAVCCARCGVGQAFVQHVQGRWSDMAVRAGTSRSAGCQDRCWQCMRWRLHAWNDSSWPDSDCSRRAGGGVR